MAESVLNIPDLIGTFDLEERLQLARDRLTSISGGQYTDTSNSDPLMWGARVVLEIVEELLYGLDANRAADMLLMRIGELWGVVPFDATAGAVDLQFTVTPGTVLALGAQVADEVSGMIFRTTSELNSIPGGVFLVPAIAVTAGALPTDALSANKLTSLRSTPSSGSVIAVTNLLAPVDGAAAETLAQYRERFPLAIKCTTVGRPGTYASAAKENSSIALANEFRSTRPLGAGVFGIDSGHVTVTVLGLGGLPPSQSLLDTVQANIVSRALFNLDPNGVTANSGVHVVAMRLRVVNVQGIVYAQNDAEISTLKAACETAIRAYLHPLTGGQKGLGHKSGARVRMTEIYTVLEGIAGVEFVDDSSLFVTNTLDMARDEIISAGTVEFDVRYGS
jgi:uncharacterized phage protein gp47/JayE